MNRMSLKCLLLGLAFTVAGCDNSEPAAPATPSDEAAHADEHGHEHADDGLDAHTGQRHDLGAIEIGAFTVDVTQIGDAHAGEPATFEIRVNGENEITAVRAWVGVESGVGSLKVKAPVRGDFYDADLEVPAPLPEDAKLWLEIETPTGASTGSFELAGEA